MALPVALSGRIVGSFAYDTVKNRLPVILTKVIDTTHRHKVQLSSKHGAEASSSDIRNLIGELSELRYRMATDKPILQLESDADDADMWNQALKELQDESGGADQVTWFNSPWLFVECYIYRRIVNAFEHRTFIKEFDPFRYLKEQAFVSSLVTITSLCDHLVGLKDSIGNRELVTQELSDIIQLCLWGNRCDLSISAGKQHASEQKVGHILAGLEALLPNILVNHVDTIVKYLLAGPKRQRVDIIMDNAGLEFVGDLCLAEVLLEANLVDVVVFHVKTMPWFVSDTTTDDFSWTLEMLRSSNEPSLNKLGHDWHQRLQEGSFVLKSHPFWTLPYPFCDMVRVCPQLHDELTQSSLLIFKGDLNFRKLVSDLDWPVDVTFSHALRGFTPAPLCVLRTSKAPVVVEVSSSVAAALLQRHDGNSWMLDGSYALVVAANLGHETPLQ